MDSARWQGVLDRERLAPWYVRSIDELADAARAGKWDAVLRLTEREGPGVNVWRVGGQSYFTPLHQAAWRGAPRDVVGALLRRGAWRTLPTAEGMSAFEIAAEHGHDHLVDLLDPGGVDRQLFDDAAWGLLDARLREVVEGRIRPFLDISLRYPVTRVLSELDGDLWFPVPGMYGGFGIRLTDEGLLVSSWWRVVGGSGQEHMITPAGVWLLDSGFV